MLAHIKPQYEGAEMINPSSPGLPHEIADRITKPLRPIFIRKLTEWAEAYKPGGPK